MSLLEVKHMDYCYCIYEFELLSIRDCVRYPKNMNICISNHQTARVRRNFFATPSPTPTIRTHSERIIFMFFHQFYEGIKPLKMLTNKYLIHCIIFYWKRLLMQMMQRVTMCPGRGWGWGWCIYYRCDCHQQHRYQLLWPVQSRGEGNWPCLQHECQQMPGLNASVIFHLVNGVTIGLIDSYSSPNKIHHGHRCAADI